MTRDNEPPKAMAGKEATALAVLVIVVGALLFAAFSFITFGLPLIVLAIGGLFWIYIGIMRWLDRIFVKREHPPDNSDPR